MPEIELPQEGKFGYDGSEDFVCNLGKTRDFEFTQVFLRGYVSDGKYGCPTCAR